MLLDPPGHSAAHGAALEQQASLLLTTYYLLLTNEQQAILLLTTYLQAIGRAVRMGQQHPVTVTRLCVTGTLEGTLTLARALALTL